MNKENQPDILSPLFCHLRFTKVMRFVVRLFSPLEPYCVRVKSVWFSRFCAAASLVFLTLVLGGIFTRPNEAAGAREVSDYWLHAGGIMQMVEAMSGDLPFRVAMQKYPMEFDRTPYVFLLATSAYLFRISAPNILLGAGVINVMLLMGGVAFFVRSLWGRRIPFFITLFLVLVFWGKGFNHACECHASILPVTASYPATFAFVLSLFALGLLIRFVLPAREKKSRIRVAQFFGFALLAGLVSLIHIRTFVCFLSLASLFILIFLTRGWRRWLVAGGLPLAILLSMFWLWPNLHYNHVKRWVFPDHSTVLPSQNVPNTPDNSGLVGIAPSENPLHPTRLYRMHYTMHSLQERAPGLIAGLIFPLLLLFRKNKKDRFLAFGALACLGVWALTGYVFQLALLGYRCLYFYAFFMQIAAARVLWTLFLYHKTRALSILLLGCMVLPIAVLEMRGGIKHYNLEKNGRIPVKEIETIRQQVGGERVLATSSPSYWLRGFGIKTGWNGARRRENEVPAVIREWLELQDGKSLERAAQQTQSRWLLIDKADALALADACVFLKGQTAYESERFVLYDLHKIAEK